VGDPPITQLLVADGLHGFGEVVDETGNQMAADFIIRNIKTVLATAVNLRLQPRCCQRATHPELRAKMASCLSEFFGEFFLWFGEQTSAVGYVSPALPAGKRQVLSEEVR